MSAAFIEFRVNSHGCFQRLRDVFVALQQSKTSGDWQNEEYWLAYFNDEERATFWWPSERELMEWEQRWFSTPLPDRWSDPTLKTPWIFRSMIDAFKNSEYELKDCRIVTGDIARLEFVPYSHPYGGTGCMEALIHAFGFSILRTDAP